MTIDTGEWVEPPTLEVTGLDIVRSDKAAITSEILNDVLMEILSDKNESEIKSDVYEIINDTYEAAQHNEIPLAKLARPRGMSKSAAKYGTPEKTPQPVYRGAKYANQIFPWEQITSGSKPMLLYIDRVRGEYPRTYTSETAEDGRVVDAISVENPDRFPDEITVDMDKQLQKVIKDPLQPILNPLGWSVDEALSDTQQIGFDSFF
jgi:DNA polymerase elongation subunit (family B)